MKKEPTGVQVAYILLTGLGLLSFGVLLFWIPFLGDMLLFFGASLTLVGILTVVAKVLK